MEYQVIARKYRPQSFKDVLGQGPIVQTLKNAIKNKRLAHAYLFCGSRGTGKTTLARVFAKALNCDSPSEDYEPCNVCSSCKEITAGHSLEVLEIDGASHRGIDDVRQINETVAYTTAAGKYKIYIIDEVHMLTKEAFNALLKTLEEPPAKVKFLFATTEPHKILPTILSRCQKFNLSRIPVQEIVSKLEFICTQQKVEIEGEALRLLAQRAEGGLRDAESLLDQIIAFHEGVITAESIANVLGIVPRQVYFELDQAGKEGDLSKAFEIAERVFSEGKDLAHFLEGLMDHFRTLAMVKISGKEAPYLSLLPADRDNYETSSRVYTQEQCLTILDILSEAQQQIRFLPAPRIALEATLLKILRIHQRLPIDFLVQRLMELEKKIAEISDASPGRLIETEERTPIIEKEDGPQEIVKTPAAPKQKIEPSAHQITEDPTPTTSDLGKKTQTPRMAASAKEIKAAASKPEKQAEASKEAQAIPSQRIKEDSSPPSPQQSSAIGQISQPPPEGVAKIGASRERQSFYDTLLQFAVIELNATKKISQ